MRHFQMYQLKYEIFLCTSCSKTYKWQDDLKRHLWLHSEKKPHYCAVCNQGFHRKSYLNLHMKKHKLELGLTETLPSDGSTGHCVQKSEKQTVGNYIKEDSDKQANVTNSSQDLITCVQVVPPFSRSNNFRCWHIKKFQNLWLLFCQQVTEYEVDVNK